MKKIIALIGLACIVSSCTDSSDMSTVPTPNNKPPVTTTGTVSTTTGTSSTGTSVEAPTASGKYLTLNYTLRVDSETGAIQETTLESVAKANNLNKTGATYQPFSVLLGANQVIYGFEQGLIGLKKGDKKVIKVSPEEGYGRPVTLEKERIAPEFTIERSRELFADTVKQTIDRSKFPTEMQAAVKNAKAGDTLTGANNATAKVVSADTASLTIEIENKENPFYGKEIKV
jgi:FKBP-type peptidyl-prolyl cis-trans isomerase 2